MPHIISEDRQRVSWRNMPGHAPWPPWHWREAERVLPGAVITLNDIFAPDYDDQQLAAVFVIMAATPEFSYRIETRQAARVAQWFEWIERGEGCLTDGSVVGDCVHHAALRFGAVPLDAACWALLAPWPLPNVEVVRLGEAAGLDSVKPRG